MEQEFDQIEGNTGEKSDYEEIKENLGEDWYEDTLTEKQIGPRDWADSGRLKEKHEEAKELKVKIAEWKTLQTELALLVVEKLSEIAEGYKEEYVSAEVAENFEKHAEQIIEAKMEQVKNDIRQEFTRDVADLEQAIQAARTESKYYRNWHEEFGEVMVNKLDLNPDQLEVLTERSGTEFEDMATEDGKVDLSGDKVEQEEQEQEMEENMEKFSPKNDDGVYELKGRPLEEQHKVLREMAENEDLLEMPTYKIAEMTDVSQTALSSKENSILDKMEDEYGTRFGID